MWLSSEKANDLTKKHGSPLYVYNSGQLKDRALQLMNLQAPYGLTVRYAMKANPNPEIIKIFTSVGIKFDASSSYEVTELLDLGIEGSDISLSSQQPAHELDRIIESGVRYIATSMHQLELYADSLSASSTVGLRVNPGFGGGHSNRVTTGGSTSSFGLWHEQIEDALSYAEKSKLFITCLQIHIGSGANLDIWESAIDRAIQIVAKMPDVTTLDIGGGYKIAYTNEEIDADLFKITEVFSNKLKVFEETSGRQIKLEIEPGRWLVAHDCLLLTEIVDIVSTGSDGYTFLRTNTGMNDFLRPGMYGAQHKIKVLNNSDESDDYVVVGHNCETGDILTPAPGDPESIKPRTLNKANIGDLLLISDTGAYCSAMSTKGYNSFPQAKEVFLN